MRNTILAIAIGVVCLVVAGVLGRVKEPHTAEHAHPVAGETAPADVSSGGLPAERPAEDSEAF